MRRKYLVPIALGLALLLALGWFGFNRYTEMARTQNLLEAQYQRAFFSMAGHMRNVEVLLGKSLATGSPTQNIMLFADIWHQTYSAQSDLGQLPIFHLALERTSKFLTQLGDFTYTLAKQNSRGVPISAEQGRILEELFEQAGILSRELAQVENEIARPDFRWSRMRQQVREAVEDAPRSIMEDAGLKQIDRQMQEFPTLIYDGPFSDHMRDRKPVGLTGDRVSEEQARNKALDFLRKTNGDYRVENTTRAEGVIATYSFEVRSTQGNREWAYIDVSQIGGHVVFFTNTRNIGESTLTMEEARERALEFTRSLNLPSMKSTYSIVQGNIAFITLVRMKDDVVIYPEQVKVQVAMDNGSIIGYEASQFLMTHRERNIPQPKTTEEEARNKINGRLTIENVRLAIIPLESLREVLTYEIRATMGEITYLVYINAINGQEERILQLIETEGGVLTM